MTQSSSRLVTYTLASRTSGVPGLEKFASSLERIRAVQDQIKRQGDVVAGLRDKTVTIRLKFEAASINAELARIQNRTVNINVKVGNLQTAQNDINTLKTLLSGLDTRTSYVVTVNTTALQAVYANINTQITQLQSLIAQLRALGGSGGPGGGGAGAGGGVSAANRQLLNDLQALNNQWKRGEIDAAAFGASLTALQGQLRTASTGAVAGTADFRALDAGLTRLTTSLRSINTDAFQKIRTDAAAMRTAFDTATAGVARNSQQFRTAVATYTTASTAMQARLQALVASGQLTTTQLGQVNREIARLGREAATIAGSVNAGGLSGNIFNALRAGFPIIGQMGGALGQAAGQAGMFGSAIGSAAAAFGPLGIAIGVTTVAVGLLTAGIMSAVNEYGKFEAQMQGVKAVSDATGKTFQGLKDQAKSLALEFGLNVNQIGQVQEELFKAGRGVEDVMGGAAKAVTVLMRATGSDLNNAVGIAGASMNTFNIQGSNMMRVADAIANGANKTALDVNTLGVALQQVGNVASGAGMSLEETVAMLGLMADRGIRGSDAGTSLKVMMQRLTSGMPEVVAGLDEFNISVYDGTGAQRDMITVLGDVIGAMDKMTDEERGAFLQKVAGSDAQRVLTASYQAGTNSLRDYIGMMDDRGRAERDAKTRMEGLQGAQAKLNTTFQIFKDTIGEVFAPAVTTLVNAATSGVSALTDLFKWLDQLDRKAAEVEKTALGKELETLQKQLVGERNQLSTLQKAADSQKRVTGNVSEQAQTRLDAQMEKVAGIEAQVKVLELQVRTEAVKNGTFVGPVQSGQDDGGREGLALTASGTDALGAMVVEASAGKLGDVSADSIVNFCAKWVRLTLDKAAPEAEAKINALFQTDSNGDGKTEATDAARNLLKAGFAQRYNPKDLKEGDVVFFTENGQNHTGVYVGKKDGVDMVRGNNRVTYMENGGKFDKYGNAISPGINPVGDVAINKLGTPNWIVRPGDMLPALGVNPPKPKNTKGPDEEDGPITAAQIAKAQKLVVALEKATKLKAENPKDVAITKGFDKAAQDLEKFSKASEENARAVKAVQSGWEGSKKGANDYIATQVDLKKYGAEALELIKRQEQATKSGNSEQIRAADEAMKLWQGTSKARIAVTQVESAAYQSRKQLAAQSRQDEEKNAALVVQIAGEAAAGREKEARAALETLKRSQADRLDLAQDDAAKRQAIVTSTGPQILAAEATINQRVREQAVAAAQKTAKDRKDVTGADAKAIEQARRSAVAEAYRIEKEANATARSEQGKAERGAARTAAQEQNQLAQELAGLKIDAAKSTSSRLKSIGDEDIRSREGDLKKQLALTKLYSQQEFDRQQKIALATRKLAYEDAKGKPNEQALREKAQAEYLATVETARVSRLNTMRTATEAAKKGQEEFNQALADGVKAGNEAIDTLDKVNLGGRDLAATAQKLPSTRAEFDTLYNRIVILRDELAEPGVADAWTQSIEDMGKVGALSAVQVQTLLNILKDLNGPRDVQQGDNLQGRGVNNTARFDDASQGTLASGEAETLLAAMIGMDPVELGSILADLVARGFGESDLGRLIQGQITAMNFDDLAQMVTDANGPRFQTDDEIRGIGQPVLEAAAAYLNLESVIQDIGQFSRSELDTLISQTGLATDQADKLYVAWDAVYGQFEQGTGGSDATTGPGKGLVNEVRPDDASKGVLASGEADRLLESMIGIDPMELGGILAGLVAKGFGESDLGKLIREKIAETNFDELALKVTTVAQANADGTVTPGGSRFQTDDDLAGKTEKVKEVQTAFIDLDSIIENVGTLGQGELQELLTTAGLLPDQIERVTAAWQDFHRETLNTEALDAQLAPVTQRMQGIYDALGNSTMTAGEARLALAAVRSELEGIGGEAAQNLIGTIDTTTQGFDELGGASAQVTAALAKLRGESEQPYDSLIRNLEEMKTKPGAAVQEIEALIAKLRELNGQAAKNEAFEKFKSNVLNIGKAIQGVFDMFGQDDIAQGVGQLVGAAESGFEAFTKFSSGDITGGILASVNMLGQLGKAIDNLDPGLKAWKKGLLEVAEAEKAAMGQRVVGGSFGQNGFLNPYYDALKEDAEKLTSKANAGFWQRLGWSLFGGAPETLDKAASETLQKASAVFNDFGSSLYSSLETELMNGLDEGDFSKASANMGKVLDRFVNKLYVQALIAKSKLGSLAKELADEVAAGQDTSGTEAQIRAETDLVIGQAQAGAARRPGYAASGPTSPSSPEQSAVTGANFYIANSSKIDTFDMAVIRMDAMYSRHEGILTRHGDVLGRHSDMLERLLRDGITLKDQQGNYRGALR